MIAKDTEGEVHRNQFSYHRQAMKRILFWISTLLVIYIGFIGYVALRQDTFIFKPRTTTDEAWTQRIESLRADYISIRADDGEVLEGMFLSDHTKVPRPTIIFFPGNAMLVEEIAPFFTELPSAGINVILMDYRGYGLSTGKPDIAWIKRDAEKIFSAASQHPEVAHDQISVWGLSLGTGIATHVASVQPVKKVILSVPFTSTLDLGMEIFPIIPRALMQKLLHQNLDTLTTASGLLQPALIFEADDDQQVPNDHADRIASVWGGAVELVQLSGQGHDDFLSNREMWEKVLEFLRAGES